MLLKIHNPKIIESMVDAMKNQTDVVIFGGKFRVVSIEMRQSRQAVPYFVEVELFEVAEL